MVKVQKLKDSVVNVKNFFLAMPKEKKIRAGIVTAAVLVAAVIITLMLNFNRSGYQVLYSNLERTEAASIYQTLLEMGASPKLNDKGEITVPQEEYDIWLLQLAAKGYPQTALPYDIFNSHSGLTATESDKQQWLLYQLQDRIQETLKRMEGVDSSVVTITMPPTSDYVWQQASQQEKATAGVLLSLHDDIQMSPQQVTAIKNLVASSVPKMEPADVTVVDGKTSLELLDSDDKDNGLTSTQNLQLEQMVQRQIEENVERILAPRYGRAGVVAAAKVTLDYDKMMTEKLELAEKPENGGGYTTHYEEEYGVNGSQAAGGIVGEENNTDIPEYAYQNPDAEGGMTAYSRSIDYDYSYIKTQVEKGNAALKRATVSVMVDEKNLTVNRRNELVSLVSNSADIVPEQIFVSAFDPAAADIPVAAEPEPETGPAELPLWVYIAFGAALLLIILLAVLLVLYKRKMKRRAEAEAVAADLSAEQMQKEIEEYKKQLGDAAKSGMSAKDDAIMGEVRSFARENPEITANLLRSWLKEGDES